MKAGHDERDQRQPADGVHRPRLTTFATAWAACIARHVNRNSAASATPGSTAHAISARRRAGEVDPAASATRAGEITTERRIANWAIEQHATAIQKIASARRKDMVGIG